jgi:serine/threonine protein kinase
MHARFVVHRDIKLESTSKKLPPLRKKKKLNDIWPSRRTDILLTANPFVSLPAEGKSLVKLTDFGLSRKIDPDDPWPSTRCGSETYAAPELLVAAHSTADEPPLPSLSRAPSDAHHTPYAYVPQHTKQPPRARTPGTYDGRDIHRRTCYIRFCTFFRCTEMESKKRKTTDARRTRGHSASCSLRLSRAHCRSTHRSCSTCPPPTLMPSVRADVGFCASCVGSGRGLRSNKDVLGRRCGTSWRGCW